MAIALLTDFGSADYFVGAMKGAILTVNPEATIVDITHDIPDHDIRTAAFTLSACYLDFPAGTIFVTVVDPGVGSARRALAAEAHGRYFVAPDNGVLSRVLRTADGFSAFEIVNERYFGPRRSATFHGRDIFAPAAAYISLGVPLSEFGPAVNDPIMFDNVRPLRVSGGEMLAEIIHIDHFGNLITNLTPDDLADNFRLRINGCEISSRRAAYSDAAAGELFVIEGSAGFLEISASGASAAEMTGAAVGETVKVTL